MSTPHLSFGKIASTPTKTAWSQAYNAGGLFVVLSLTLKDPEKEHEALTIIGKNFINDLEAEFFTLDRKNLEGIQKALEKVLKEIPETVVLTCVVAYSKEQIVYLFVIGNGIIMLKRESKLGTILSQKDSHTRTIHAASGNLKNGDTMVLASQSFHHIIPENDLTDALSSDELDEAVEALMPHVHKRDDGSASGIVFRFQEKKLQISEESSVPLSPRDDEPSKLHSQEHSPKAQHSIETEKEIPTRDDHTDEIPASHIPKKTKLSFSLPPFVTSLSHRKKVFLTVALSIIVVLCASIVFTITTGQAKERKALFDDVYPKALENYEEGEGLLTLNKALAWEELEEAKALLETTDGKFPNGSDEYDKTKELQSKIENLLVQVGDSRALEAKEIPEEDNLLLSVLIPDDRISAVEDETSVYYLTNSEVVSIRKGSKSEQTLIENKSDWDNGVSLGKFGSNFYVLDTQNGILKFVPSGSAYSSSDYLTEDIDMSNAVSMSIDGSVYVLFDNGEIKKFNRGAEEAFEITGLESPFSSPIQIFTTEDIDNLYVLDPNASRIVKLSIEGTFIEEYLSSVLTDAKGFYISPDEQTAYVLSDGTLYSLSI